MIILYRILFPVLAILLSPYYLRRMLRRGGYQKKLRYRLGMWPKLGDKENGKKRIWIQAVSVGEVSSITKLLHLLFQNENFEIILSGTTSTGLETAEKKFGNQVKAHGPFPLDWFLFSQKAWKQIEPDLIVMVDSELWPEHFHQAKKRGIPLIIINARLSDRSFSRLSKLSWLHPLLLPNNLQVITASERQTKRWKSLGLRSAQALTSGNLKIDAVDLSQTASTDRASLIKEFGFDQESIVIAGISTWPGEERMLIEITQSLRLENLDVRLLLVPRHAERRNDVIKTLQTCELPNHVRTQKQSVSEGNVVYLGDTTGELSQLIRVADIGFMGKTLPPNHGGQNPIEPVALQIPLVVGPHFQNFHETCTDMFLHHAAIECKSKGDVVKELRLLARDRVKRTELKNRAKKWMDKQGSPSIFTSDTITEALRK